MLQILILLLKPSSITLAGSELVRSWFESDSVVEFGFYHPLCGSYYVLWCYHVDDAARSKQQHA